MTKPTAIIKKYWYIFPILIVSCVGIGCYQLDAVVTTIATPTLGQQCDPISQKLIGYNGSGYPICVTDQTGNGGAGIIRILSGGITTSSFTTSSISYVPSGFPTAKTFTKHYSNSQLWINMVIDDRNSCNHATNYIRIYVDGNKGLNWSHPTGIANTVTAYSYFENIGATAGNHTISVDVATSAGCTGTFQTDIAQLQVFEVPLT